MFSDLKNLKIYRAVAMSGALAGAIAAETSKDSEVRKH